MTQFRPYDHPPNTAQLQSFLGQFDVRDLRTEAIVQGSSITRQIYIFFQIIVIPFFRSYDTTKLAAVSVRPVPAAVILNTATLHSGLFCFSLVSAKQQKYIENNNLKLMHEIVSMHF